jgi:hypothetical protein
MLRRSLRILWGKLLEEAGPVAGVAYGAGGVCPDKYSVTITVVPYRTYLDIVARGLSFVPEFLAAAAVEPDVLA